MHAISNYKKIVRVLVEVLVRFGKQGERCRVPDNLVDADDVRLETMECIAFNLFPKNKSCRQLNQENSIAVNSTHIDRAVERNRNPRLRIEPVKLVQERDVRAI